MIKSINNSEFKERLESGEYILIDLRSPEEINFGKISPDALEIDFYDPNLKLIINTLDREGKYLIYCNSGGRSKMILKLMESMEFMDVYELDCGISGW